MAWTNDNFRDAVNKGKSGGSLSSHEEQKLKEAAKQAGARGREAQEALNKRR
jgi:hypothetical protein